MQRIPRRISAAAISVFLAACGGGDVELDCETFCTVLHCNDGEIDYADCLVDCPCQNAMYSDDVKGFFNSCTVDLACTSEPVCTAELGDLSRGDELELACQYFVDRCETEPEWFPGVPMECPGWGLFVMYNDNYIDQVLGCLEQPCAASEAACIDAARPQECP